MWIESHIGRRKTQSKMYMKLNFTLAWFSNNLNKFDAKTLRHDGQALTILQYLKQFIFNSMYSYILDGTVCKRSSRVRFLPGPEFWQGTFRKQDTHFPVSVCENGLGTNVISMLQILL